jgi:predicted dehydrogenase
MMARSNRREFLKRGAAAGVGLWVAGGSAWAQGKSPNEKLNIGCIGVEGKGASDMRGVASENIVAMCDIDDQSLARAAMRFPQAAKYNDFRKLLERKDIDAVVVSTPDHVHAFATNMALKLGKHVYCQKPLTHSVHEARMVAQTAARQKVATQMGNQGHEADNTRRIVELIRSGAIGPVREVHAWTNRPVWPQGIDRPSGTPPVPEHVHWDLWLGPSPERPYNPAYHPFKWRGWWDFGCGALGDMACHIMDPAFWALSLGSPSAVEAEGPPAHPETAPTWMIVRYEFPPRGEMPPVKVTWYDGGKRPPADLVEGERLVDNGLIFIGDQGKVYVPDTYGGKHMLLPKARFADFKAPEPYLANSPGPYAEWIAACKTGSPTGSNFANYAGPFTEMVLLGNVAYRAGRKIEWNASELKCSNCPDAERFIRLEYRRGWEL